jgi:hypothetical protein
VLSGFKALAYAATALVAAVTFARSRLVRRGPRSLEAG